MAGRLPCWKIILDAFQELEKASNPPRPQRTEEVPEKLKVAAPQASPKVPQTTPQVSTSHQLPWPSVPTHADLRAVVEPMLAHDPTQRPTAASLLENALSSWLSDASQLAVNPYRFGHVGAGDAALQQAASTPEKKAGP